MNKKIDKILVVFVVELLNGRGGMENVTSQLVSALNKDGRFHAGIFVINNGEKSQSALWMDNAKLAESKCSLRNSKIKRLIHTINLALFIKKNNPTHIISLNTIPTLIAKRAIKLSTHRSILSTWMHLPPRERYRPHYLPLADHHFAISAEIKNQLTQLGAKPDSIDVVYNPVKLSNVVFPRPNVIRLLYVGRVHFEDQKQLKDLFDALVLSKIQWSLDLVGDGEDRARCEQYTQQLGIANHITWHGWQDSPWDYIEKNIKETSCLLLTSNHEGFPLVLLEAMSRGIYCIASDCISGPSEIIKPNINGELYSQNNVLQLSKIIDSLEGKTLPTPQDIKSSISNFYEDQYMAKFTRLLIKYSEVKND